MACTNESSCFDNLILWISTNQNSSNQEKKSVFENPFCIKISRGTSKTYLEVRSWACQPLPPAGQAPQLPVDPTALMDFPVAFPEPQLYHITWANPVLAFTISQIQDYPFLPPLQPAPLGELQTVQNYVFMFADMPHRS